MGAGGKKESGDYLLVRKGNALGYCRTCAHRAHFTKCRTESCRCVPVGTRRFAIPWHDSSKSVVITLQSITLTQRSELERLAVRKQETFGPVRRRVHRQLIDAGLAAYHDRSMRWTKFHNDYCSLTATGLRFWKRLLRHEAGGLEHTVRENAPVGHGERLDLTRVALEKIA